MEIETNFLPKAVNVSPVRESFVALLDDLARSGIHAGHPPRFSEARGALPPAMSERIVDSRPERCMAAALARRVAASMSGSVCTGILTGFGGVGVGILGLNSRLTFVSFRCWLSVKRPIFDSRPWRYLTKSCFADHPM